MRPKPPVNKLAFGKIFTDHMLTIDWNKEEGWAAPQITPFENFSMHPGAKVRKMRKSSRRNKWISLWRSFTMPRSCSRV